MTLTSASTFPAPLPTRSLATIETITEISPIPNADAIVRARVRGWDVVVRSEEFVVGDAVLYIEVDSLLPSSDTRFEFLIPRGVRTTEEGLTGHVLKTARLRGQYSQGIAFALADFPELDGLPVGADVTSALHIVKWDPPLPGELAGSVTGFLPSTIPVSGELRVQNFAEVLGVGDDGHWVATEKIDGTSMTVWVEGFPAADVQGHFGVAGRNYEFAFNEKQAFWAMALELNLHRKLRYAYPNAFRIAVQGEFYGAGVLKKNTLDVTGKHFAAFTLYVDGNEVARPFWPDFLKALSVPVHDLPYPKTVDEALAQVDGLKSLVNPARNAEGVVWRNTESTTVMVGDRPVRASWKCISNRYAMKNDA